MSPEHVLSSLDLNKSDSPQVSLDSGQGPDAQIVFKKIVKIGEGILERSRSVLNALKVKWSFEKSVHAPPSESIPVLGVDRKVEPAEPAQQIEAIEAQVETAVQNTLAKISERLGSNHGGWYEDKKTGKKYYIKFYENQAQAQIEFIANAIYEKLGIAVPHHELKEIDGKLAILSEEVTGAQVMSREQQASNSDVRQGFIADAFLANWDVVGGIFDNIVQGVDGRVYRIDNGGSLIFRARGGTKEVSPTEIPELVNMLKTEYPAGQVFAGLSDIDIAAQIKELLNRLGEQEIIQIIDSSGLATDLAENLKKSLIGRRNFLAKKLELSRTKEGFPSDPLAEKILLLPEIVSHTTIRYQVPEYEGRELRPGQKMVFVIPEEFSERFIRDIVLQHRKPEKYRKDIGPDRYDPYGAYNRVEVWDPENQEWLGWSDPKGYSSDKFAESRPASSPENEILHDWLAAVGQKKIKAIRITNVGKNSDYSVAAIHGLEVIFFPDLANVFYEDRVYCSGTKFIDLDKKQTLPTYGGGSHTEGKYLGAIALGGGSSLYELSSDPGESARLEGGRLAIQLKPGRNLIQAEISVGDTEHLDHINPKTNRHTRLGWAKLWVGIRRAKSSQIDWFIQNANVAPQGVIAGGPHIDQSLIEDGDELVIESRSDTSYVMGWRLAYKNLEESPLSKAA